MQYEENWIAHIINLNLDLNLSFGFIMPPASAPWKVPEYIMFWGCPSIRPSICPDLINAI